MSFKSWFIDKFDDPIEGCDCWWGFLLLETIFISGPIFIIGWAGLILMAGIGIVTLWMLLY